MRVSVLSNLYPPFVIGGYELNCRNVVQELKHRGHEVEVLTTPNHVPGERDPAYVRRCLSSVAFQPQSQAGMESALWLHDSDISSYHNISMLIDHLVDYRPDIVFLWNLHGLGGLHIVDILTLAGVPWAIYLGDRVFEQMLSAASLRVKQIYRGHLPAHFASGLSMVVSEHLAEEIRRLGRFEFPREPLVVHGYAQTRFPYIDHSYLSTGSAKFIFAGRVDEHKGVSIILEAAKLLKAKNYKFSIDFYGEGNIGYYTSLAIALSVEDRIHFHGGVSQDFLHHQYLTHDAFLFPTWEREPFAFAPFEAAAYGCVPILTDNCGCSERLVDRVHCLKVRREPVSLATAMAEVINGELDLLDIGRAGASLVREDLGFQANVDLMEAALGQEVRPWDPHIIEDKRFKLLAFSKHNLSVAWALNQAD